MFTTTMEEVGIRFATSLCDRSLFRDVPVSPFGNGTRVPEFPLATLWCRCVRAARVLSRIQLILLVSHGLRSGGNMSGLGILCRQPVRSFHVESGPAESTR
jgi:hypothetical protein